MVEVEMSDDIRKYETKSFGPFTTRQVLCMLIALVYAVPIGLLIPLSWDKKILIGALCASPCILCGYIKLDGTYFEVLFFRFLYWQCLTPAKRKCKTTLDFKEEMAKMKQAEETKKLAKMTPKQRNAYNKHQKTLKTIVYSKKKEYHIYK